MSRYLVPVSFVSDRKPNSLHYSEDRSGDQLQMVQNITFGTIWVPVETGTVSSSEQASLGWRLDEPRSEKLSVESQMDKQPSRAINIGALDGKVSVFDFSPDEFGKQFGFPPSNAPTPTTQIEEFSRLVSARSNPRFILYAHGCCVSRKASFEGAAKLAAAARLPIFMFDWASPGVADVLILPELNAYHRSERALELSAFYFHELLNVLASKTSSECVFVGHSMGNHLIIDELVRRDDTRQLHFDQIHLVRADVSLSAYLRAERHLSRFSRMIYVYCSDKDFWLRKSARLGGNAARLGRIGNQLDAAVRSGAGLSSPSNRLFLDITNATPAFDRNLGHGMPDDLVAHVINFGVADGKNYVFQRPSDQRASFRTVLKANAEARNGVALKRH